MEGSLEDEPLLRREEGGLERGVQSLRGAEHRALGSELVREEWEGRNNATLGVDALLQNEALVDAQNGQKPRPFCGLGLKAPLTSVRNTNQC